MSQSPDTPSFTGFNTPSRIEADIEDLQHTGTIPRELDGAFYRVQPDPQFPPRLGDDISFNGDGMITRFHFHDGQCDFRQRWAQTDKWKAERQAGKALFGAYRNPLTDDDSVKGMIRSTKLGDPEDGPGHPDTWTIRDGADDNATDMLVIVAAEMLTGAPGVDSRPSI